MTERAEEIHGDGAERREPLVEALGESHARDDTADTADTADAADAAERRESRVWTVPNVLSFLRLLGVPVFLWLVLVPKADGWAVGLLVAAALTDWLDGKIARAFNQTSRLGRIIDPAADKLYVFATVAGLLLREAIPWWLAAAVLGRELFVACFIPVLRRHGYKALQVHFLGKAAMANLMYAFPLLFLASHTGAWYAEFTRIVGWAFALWGVGLYWWAGVLYVVQVRRLVSAAKGGAGKASKE
ncbi:CDP-alcohol phosphatidyltransferase family protein [Thermoactinospora rubra]|uniref:CDP-alcohol phosphatidyltransferase family protein n=1 Tax=Thermoactinospora rubra TaxID=1088767 RepID=UPI001F0A6326|nr:CDP-alcohol phosphatidyltransferase family protein [Thermoactinospora rubra]